MSAQEAGRQDGGLVEGVHMETLNIEGHSDATAAAALSQANAAAAVPSFRAHLPTTIIVNHE